MILRVLLVALLLAPLVRAQEVEGLGVSLNDWKNANAKANCSPTPGKDNKPRGDGSIDCRSNLEDKGDHSLGPQLEGQQMADVMYHFEGGRLVEIYGYFDSNRFATVEAALTEKLGKPSLRQYSRYHNAFGAKYDGAQILWKRSKAIFELTQLAGTVKTSRLVILAR